MKKFILFILGIVVAFFAFIVIRAFWNNSHTKNPQNTLTVLKNVLPFSPSEFLGSKNSPVGQQTNTSTDAPPLFIDASSTEQGSNVSIIPRMRHYTLVPTAGQIVLEKNKDVIRDRVKVKEKGYYVRYVDRGTGHIFEIKTDAPNPIKISNTTIPKIYEAFFLPNGNSLVARFLDNSEQIVTYLIDLKDKISTSTQKTASTTNTVEAQALVEKQTLKDVKGIYLPANINQISLSAGGKIAELSKENEQGVLSLLDTSRKPKIITTSPLKEWLINFQGENQIVLTTKPSGLFEGYSYVFDINTSSLKKIAGGILGLTVLPSFDNSTYLIGEGGENTKLSILSKKDNKSTPLSIRGLPEKCVWSRKNVAILYCAAPNNVKNSLYPDNWYKGKIFFNDSLWQIDTKTGNIKILSNFSIESGQAIDAINITLSPDETYVTFINKIDLSLWGLDLSKNPTN